MTVCAGTSEVLTAILIDVIRDLIVGQERRRVLREHGLDVAVTSFPIVREVVVGADEAFAFVVRGVQTEEIGHGSNVQQELSKES